MAMFRRILGRGLVVSALGLGCMGMSDFYEGDDRRRARETLRRAIERGCRCSTPPTPTART
jgi:aryl-alcohol dehydrogenase-like predicted oxidoreductase